jgi:hypothetical protein
MYHDNQGCFVTEHSVPEVLRRTPAGTAFQNIDITNISLAPTELWVTMHSGTYFLYKNGTDDR